MNTSREKKPRKLKILLRKDKSSYSFEKSPLYRVRGLQQFRAALGIGWNDSSKLLHNRFYAEFEKVAAGKKPRLIQHPIYELAAVHNRIASLLARITVPDYVFSQRGRSHIDNASEHRGNVPLVKTDICSFYPSTSRDRVFRLFRDGFECASDIANRLADLCCFRQLHLPTGSQLSGYLAFFAAREMFDEIVDYLVAEGCNPTLYVDDLTISGETATLQTLSHVRELIRKHGFSTSNDKSVTYASNQPKEITGSIIVGERLLLPNARHLLINRLRSEFEQGSEDDRLKIAPSLRGRLSEAQQLEFRRFA